ncbi:MAG TPA: MBL fold metallo-hydrolase [Candidatus Paceibacterota bacterium]
MEKHTKSKTEKLKLTFCGGVGAVTGANFLLEGAVQGHADKTLKLLVDCGLEQGTHEASEKNHRAFIYDPSQIDYLLVTHAHMDHIGKIPKLIKDGFEGVIYSTPETLELTRLMLADALKLTTQEAERNKVEALYDREDLNKVFTLWKTIPFHKDFNLAPGYDLYLKDAGHVLGSSMFELTYTAEGEDKKRKIVFTGDLGNSPTPLLRDTEEVTDADYLIMESVYGDRNHESRDVRLQKLEDVIEDNIARKGVLLIPVFSLEKTQELLYEIHKLFEKKQIPPVPVYLDSPLAIRLTEVYRKMSENFNEAARAEFHKHDLFKFPTLHVTESAEASQGISAAPSPKIIMAGSGMSNGGRIQRHEAHYLTDPNNTIVFIGYQSVGTMGRTIQSGAKEIQLFGNNIQVRAHIETIDGYSSHKDSDHLLEFVSFTEKTVKKVFVVMGETKASLFLVQRIRDYLGLNAVHPEEGDTVVLE